MKIKKKTKNYIKKLKKTPEEVLFLALAFISLIFAFFCVGNIKNEPLMVGVDHSWQNRVSPMEKKIKKMVKGFPIQEMAPHIAKKDKKVAAYLVAIAKKESNWGLYSPKKNGKECYNYWGYRGTYNQTASGYSCFDSPNQAVKVVGERIQELISEEQDTPQEMVLWKCGNNRLARRSGSAMKWIKDVSFYYGKLYNKT